MQTKPFDLFAPAIQDTACLFASPHSGRDYTPEFIEQSPLGISNLRSSEDAFVDLLFASAPRHGANLLCARAPRAWVDLNRAEDELDPALIDGISLRRGGLNPRIASGLGVIPRVVAGGKVIHPGRIAMSEVEQRLAFAWRPYHAILRRLMDDTRDRHGQALLIDCHSTPHEALRNHVGRASCTMPTPEIILGDRHGTSCAPAIMDAIEAVFRRAGFRVVRNAPFAGVHICRDYGHPPGGHHVVQVEIDRSLYMDEATITPLPGFESFRTRIDAVIQDLAALGRDLPRGALAAE